MNQDMVYSPSGMEFGGIADGLFHPSSARAATRLTRLGDRVGEEGRSLFLEPPGDLGDLGTFEDEDEDAAIIWRSNCAMRAAINRLGLENCMDR